MLSQYLSGYYLDLERYQITTQYILPRLDSATRQPNLPIQVALYLDSPTIGELYYQETEQSLQAGERQYEIYYTSRIRNEAWYRSLRLSYDSMQWLQAGSDRKYGYISLVRPLIDYHTLNAIGLVKIRAKLKDIFADVDDDRLGKDTLLLAVGEDR